MIKLTKIQKILILVSIFWEMFAYNISYYNYGHRLDFEKFMLASSPVILYWSVVWIWGFGTFVKFFRNVKNNAIVRTSLKYFMYIIALGLIMYILGIQDLINEKAIEKAVGGALGAAIVATLVALFSGSKNDESNKVEENTENKKDRTTGFVPIFLIIFMLFLAVIEKGNKHENKDNIGNPKQIVDLNNEIRRVSTYIGWKFKETELTVEYCRNNGYELKNYKEEFAELTKEDEYNLKRFLNKLSNNEVIAFNQMIQQVKPIIRENFEKEFRQVISQNKGVTIKEMCKNIDDNAKEILTDVYENVIKRQYKGIYTDEELHRIDELTQKSKGSVKFKPLQNNNLRK